MPAADCGSVADSVRAAVALFRQKATQPKGRADGGIVERAARWLCFARAHGQGFGSARTAISLRIDIGGFVSPGPHSQSSRSHHRMIRRNDAVAGGPSPRGEGLVNMCEPARCFVGMAKAGVQS